MERESPDDCFFVGVCGVLHGGTYAGIFVVLYVCSYGFCVMLLSWCSLMDQVVGLTMDDGWLMVMFVCVVCKIFSWIRWFFFVCVCFWNVYGLLRLSSPRVWWRWRSCLFSAAFAAQ